MPMTITNFRAFLAIHIYMQMKKQSNMKTYWEKAGFIFHCPIISNIMTLARFKELRQCMHVTNLETYAHIEQGQVGYDKMRHVRWLVNDISDACIREGIR